MAAEAAAAAVLPESFLPDSCIRQALCSVGKPEKGYRVYYELHGSSSPNATRVVLLCGMYSPSSSTLHTVRALVNSKAKTPYTILAFDNRGTGQSYSPKGRYKTSGMASDTVSLLNHIGWTDDRSLHFVAISLGGMIAQEVALLIPTRIASLTMTSTRAGPIPEFPSLKVAAMLARQMTGTVRSPRHAASMAVETLFPKGWLDEPLAEGKGTRRAELEAEYEAKFAKGGGGTAYGRLGQFWAVTCHYVSPQKLSTVLSTIPRVHLIVGDEDELIAPIRTRQIHEAIPKSTYRLVKGGGHTLPLQFEEEYHQWIEDVIAEAIALVKQSQERHVEKVQQGREHPVELEEVEDLVVRAE